MAKHARFCTVCDEDGETTAATHQVGGEYLCKRHYYEAQVSRGMMAPATANTEE